MFDLDDDALLEVELDGLPSQVESSVSSLPDRIFPVEASTVAAIHSRSGRRHPRSRHQLLAAEEDVHLSEGGNIRWRKAMMISTLVGAAFGVAMLEASDSHKGTVARFAASILRLKIAKSPAESPAPSWPLPPPLPPGLPPRAPASGERWIRPKAGQVLFSVEALPEFLIECKLTLTRCQRLLLPSNLRDLTPQMTLHDSVPHSRSSTAQFGQRMVESSAYRCCRPVVALAIGVALLGRDAAAHQL